MSTLRVNTLQTPAGVEVYTAKAWVNFNGTGTVAIRASGNVSSITDNGVGDYTVNFTVPMVDANYTVSPSAIGWWATETGVRTVSNVRMQSFSSGGFTGFDASIFSLAIFR